MIATVYRSFFAILPALIMVIYFGGIIALVIYIIWLLHRLVKAVERIAEKI
jgi:flagellar biogenesis protein FliO